MRNAINKDFFREIKYTLNRYVSILLIVALGVAFLAGIRAACPDMKLSLDHYLDEADYMDLRVLSTLGLTEEDLTAIAEVDGVKDVDGAHSYDAFVMNGNEKWTLRFLSEPTSVNKLEITDGRDIENTNECVVDHLLIEKDGYHIGDQITVTPPGKDEKLSDTLTESTFTIVGVAASPEYFTTTRDTTSIGTGQTDAFVFLSPAVFKSDIYSAVYITVDGAAAKQAYSDDYEAVVDKVKARLEDISSEREAARYNGIVDDANAEIDDARDKLADAKAEAESELDDAWAQIQDGEQQINDGQKELDDNRAAYEDQIAAARAKLSSGEQELQDGQAEITSNEQKLQDGQAQIMAARQQLEDSSQILAEKKQQYKAGLRAANAGQEQLTAGQAKLTEASEALQSQETALNEQKTSLQEQKETLTAQQTELEQGIAQLETQKEGMEQQRVEAATGEEPDEAQIAQLDTQIAALQEQLNQLDAQKNALAEGISQVDGGLDQIEAGLSQIASGKEELNEQQEELNSQQANLDETFNQLAEAKTQLDAGSSQLASGRQQLDSKQQELDSGKAALNQAKAQLQSGQAEIDKGKAELKSQMTSAEAQFAEAERKLADAKAELADAKEKYASGKKEAQEKIADAEKKIQDAEDQLADVDYPEWYVLDRNSTQGFVEYEQNAERIGAIGKIFPLIFFLVAALVSLTTMTRMVESQRTEIGTLKALGYSNWSIARKYVFYALSASLIGSLIGLVLGQKLLPWVIITAYRVLYPNLFVVLTPLNAYYSVTASGAAVICVTGAALASCYRELVASPAELMRPSAPAAGRKILLEHVGFIWHHMKFTSKVAMRNLFRYKKRFFMTIFGIGGCTALVVFAFGLTDSISGVAHRQYDELFHYDMTLTLDDNADEADMDELYDFLDHNDGLKADQYTRLRSMSMSVKEGNKEASYTAYLTVPEDTEIYKDFVVLQDRKTGTPYAMDDETVIITEKLANLLGVNPGDKITVTDNDVDKEVTVGHIAENYLMSYVYMSPALYETTFGEAPKWNKIEAFIPGLTSENSEKYSSELLALNAVSGTSTTDYVRSKFEEVLNSLDIVTLILMVAAGMLAFIVLYNLNNINITERRRELATIKVLGFYDLEVAEYVYRENILLTIIGALVGAVFGKYLHAYIITSVETEVIMFIRHADFSSYIYAIIITFGFSIFVNWLMYYRLKKIDMVESLKSVE